MDCFIVSNYVQVTKLEVQELIGKDSEGSENVCIVRDCSPSDLATLCYRCQSALHICLLIGRGPSIDNITYSSLEFFKEKSFGVIHHKGHEHELQSTDIAGSIGKQLVDHTSSPVKLSRPDVQVLSYNTSKEFFVGIDLCEVELSKRPYKLASHPGSLNGAFAYTLLRIAGMQKESIFVDPCCGTGTLVIEAALFAQASSPFRFTKKLGVHKFFPEESEQVQDALPTPTKSDSVNGFDASVKTMLQAQKNAKVAGIHESLTISKVALDWLDAKFDEHQVDLIVTNPPKINKRTKNDKQIEKIYDDLFYQAKYVLKKKATLGILLVSKGRIEEIAAKHKFSLKETIPISSGKQEYQFFLFVAP